MRTKTAESYGIEAYQQNRELPSKYQTPDNCWLDWYTKGFRQAARNAVLETQLTKDNALNSHIAVCPKTNCASNNAYEEGYGNNQCTGSCEYVRLFTRKINEDERY